MERIRKQLLINYKVFEYKICYLLASRVDAIFYEVQDFTYLLLKLMSPASIYLILK